MNTQLTQDQQALLSYIQQQNAEKIAWQAEDPAHRSIGIFTEDLTHWSSYGITTVAGFRRSLLVSDISDTYKDLYGFRPRYSYNEMSVEELEACLQSLNEALDREITREREAELGLPDSDIPTSWEDQGFSHSITF